MPQMIVKDNELIRICPTNHNKIEYSTSQGRVWITRCINGFYGEFLDLVVCGNELLATTEKALLYSTNNGRTWLLRKRN